MTFDISSFIYVKLFLFIMNTYFVSIVIRAILWGDTWYERY